MFARVSKYQAADVQALLDGFNSSTEALEKIDGFLHAYFLVDRDGGKGMSITFWDSQKALVASAEEGERLRRQASEAGGATIDSVEEYETGLITSSPTTVDGRTYRHHLRGDTHPIQYSE
jgi:heme-degrading monooxygenase HmoA